MYVTQECCKLEMFVGVLNIKTIHVHVLVGPLVYNYRACFLMDLTLMRTLSISFMLAFPPVALPRQPRPSHQRVSGGATFSAVSLSSLHSRHHLQPRELALVNTLVPSPRNGGLGMGLPCLYSPAGNGGLGMGLPSLYSPAGNEGLGMGLPSLYSPAGNGGLGMVCCVYEIAVSPHPSIIS